MKIVRRGNTLYVLDSINREVILKPSIVNLDDIFKSHWGKIIDHVITDYDEVLIDNVSSFKGLRHYVAGYICVNDMDRSKIPERYITSYERNSHIYKPTKIG